MATKKEDLISKALESYTCLYCKKTMKSGSGRTLHLKQCTAIKLNTEAGKKFKPGDTVRYQMGDHKVVESRDGLVLLSNEEVVPATKLKESDGTKSTKIARGEVKDDMPKTISAWLDYFIERNKWQTPVKAKTWINTLYHMTYHPTSWKVEEFEALLDKKFPSVKIKSKT